MKVNFTSDNKKRYKICGIYKYAKIPQVKLTDEQVKEVNKTRRLPGDLFVKTNETFSTAFYGPQAKAAIQIVKYENRGKEHPAAFAKITKTLPDGYKLENYKNKTYIAFNDVDIQKEKKKFKSIVGGLITSSFLALGAFVVNKVRKK